MNDEPTIDDFNNYQDYANAVEDYVNYNSESSLDRLEAEIADKWRISNETNGY